MNTINIVFAGLVIFSLVIIVVIYGRNAGKIDRLSEEDTNKLEEKKNIIVRFFGFLLEKIKGIFIFLAEWFVKKIKKLLHLVHFWLIKMKKGKDGNGIKGEIEAKKELVKEEEENLETVITEDLAGDEEEFPPKNKKGDVIDLKKTDQVSSSEFFQKEMRPGVERKTKQEMIEENEKIEEDEEVEEAEAKEEKNFWKRIFSRSKKESTGEAPEEELPNEVNAQLEDDLASGVTKIEKKDILPEGASYIEDVKIKDNNLDVDEELGVDMKILEKKILQKIEREPRSVNGYRELGELYIKMKNYDDALETYNFVLKISPRNAQAKRKIEKIRLLKRLN